VNSLVWALPFVAVFGPGALAGVLAIAFRSIGCVGKLFGEAFDTAMNLFQWDRVAAILLAIFVVVLVAEVPITALRKRII